MKTMKPYLSAALFIAIALGGCTKSESKAPQNTSDAKTEKVESEGSEEQKEGSAAAQQAEKIMGDDMYLERARSKLKPENMEAELNRIEKDLDKLERKVEQGEAAIRERESGSN